MQFTEDTSPEAQLFNLFGLTPTQLDSVIGAALGANRDRATCDIYLQAKVADSLAIEFDSFAADPDGVLKNASRQIEKGAGVRVVCGEKFGYAYTDDVTFANLMAKAREASMCLSVGVGTAISVPKSMRVIPHNLYQLDGSYQVIALSEKASLLRAVIKEAKAFDSRIKGVTAGLNTVEETIIIANSIYDNFVVDNRPMLRLSVSCVAEGGGDRTTGTGGGGGRVDISFLTEGNRWRDYTHKAADTAIKMLGAKQCPAGEMTVVLNHGWPGVLIHEAVGHGLEADFNRMGVSAFSGQVGNQVASPLCTIIDDGTLGSRRGSLNVDDEGTPTARNVLIENGVLKGYLKDGMHGNLLKGGSTGSGRREGFRSHPMCRMTNTYLAAGESSPEEIIRSVKRGLYIVNMGGGQVEIASGKFTFTASGAIEIVDGKLGAYVKGATLVGSGPEALKHVIAVGNDVAIDEGVGTCGKDGQAVPVCVGMPTVAIEKVTVGGADGN